MRAWIMGLAAAAALAMWAAGAAAQPAATSSDLESAFEAARQVSPVPLSLDRDLAEWTEYGDHSAEGRARRLEDLTIRAARDRAAWDLRTTPADLARACVPIVLRDCQSVAGGHVTRQDGPTLYWQVQRGFTEWDGVGGGFVLLQLEADGVTLRPAAWDFEGFVYQQPEWAEGAGGPDGDLFVAVAGTQDGTGAQNADVMFRIVEGGERPLVQIDNLSWRDTLDDRLPQGLEVWKGVRFFYGALMAETSLWRTNDANCCPTGGEAFLDFEIRDDRLALTGVQVKDALATLAQQVPADVFAWVQRRMACDHWGGEEPYDAERAAQIDAALSEARCETLGADEQALRRTHADDEAVLDILARAGAM
ncbi:MAG: hypothetical protein ACI8U3_001472 [Brevundimonas sp.]|jgi:hypothetical protein|uniref:hypothetical protein n=1 Tax=Brevundimonas sp. TaxID=1871086 RepID=UPI0039E2CC2C